MIVITETMKNAGWKTVNGLAVAPVSATVVAESRRETLDQLVACYEAMNLTHEEARIAAGIEQRSINETSLFPGK
jgi:hypothetical protein